MTKQVRFYFAYNSPYSFLANTRLEKELAPFHVEVLYRPVYSPRSGAGPDFNSPRFRYLFEDVGRFADAYGLNLRPGPFADTRKACLGLFSAQAHGKGRAYHDGVYSARWLEEMDIGQDETLAAVAQRAGLDHGAFLDDLHGNRYAAALERSNDEAAADGVFGFPFFIYEGKKFWGNDRIEWLVRELAKQ
jgi:2-hydroxychromene-2-carboxylate isomerase